MPHRGARRFFAFVNNVLEQRARSGSGIEQLEILLDVYHGHGRPVPPSARAAEGWIRYVVQHAVTLLSVFCRCSDPAVRHKLVRCCVIPHSGWLMQEVTQGCMGLSWFRPRGRTSSKGVCECTVLSCTEGACSRGYKRDERGRETLKSLLGD